MLPFLIFVLVYWFRVANAQWPSIEVAQTRFTGVCGEAGQFDCGVVGENRCIPLRNFHDGHPNCPDESDEYCFPGQIRCGSHCANLEHLADCLTTPRCADELGIKSSPDTQEASFCSLLKRKLCVLPGAIPCKGYGECVLRKWLLDGKSDCFDGSDEDPQYANLFKFVEKAGHHIQPHIVSTGSGQQFFPFGIVPVDPAPTEVQMPASPVPITVPPLPTQPTQPPTQPSTPRQTPLTTAQPTKPPFQSIPDQTIGTLYPNQPTATARPSTLYPGQPTKAIESTPSTLYPNQKVQTTLYPNQPTTHATLYPNQPTTNVISSTKPTPTWWPFGKETFETTKEYVDKLDEFGEIYGPATHPWHSADKPTPPPTQLQQHFTPYPAPSSGVNEGTAAPTMEEWEVFPKEGAQATSIEPTGFTVDLPVSPGADLLKPWWLPTKASTPPPIPKTETLYPGQKVEQAKPTEDTKPFVVPGSGIFVWPNGTVNGPWLTKSTSTRSPFIPITTATTRKLVTLATPTRTSPTTTQKPSTTLPSDKSTVPSGGVWLINPAQPQPNLPATPILIPPTYMPVVSTYPPDEIGPPVSTVLPIYPEIGENVKKPTVGRPEQKPTVKTTEPVTIPAIQTTIGEGGFETTTEEWLTKEQATTTSDAIPPQQTSLTSVRTTEKPKATTTLPAQTTLQVEVTSEQMSSSESGGRTTTVEWAETTHSDVSSTGGVSESATSSPQELETTTEKAGSQSTQSSLTSSTQTTKQDQEPSISDWAPLVSVGGLTAILGDAKLRKLNCHDRLQKIADKLGSGEPECRCGVGEMRLRTGRCVRAPLATFRVKVKKLCERDLEREDEKLAASLVLLKIANGGTQTACVREYQPNSAAFVLNAMCSSAANCSVEELQRSVSGGKKEALSELDIEVEELQEGACSSDALNDCASGSVCKPFGLRFHCHCPTTELDSKNNGQDCVVSVGCTRFLGLCIVIWLLIFLLSLCILPLLCGYFCYRCGYLQKTAIWPKLQELGIFRQKRTDLEAGAPRPTSPTQQKHNEGLPRPPDAPVIPSARLPEIPAQPAIKEQEDSVPDYYKGNESEYETDSASHGLVSLVSTEQSGVTSEAEAPDQSKTVAQVHKDASRVDSKVEEKKADEEEKRSTSSRAGTPTIWEKFQILGTQYTTEVTEKPPSDTNSLDSLLRRYQEKEFVKLKEREPELFRIQETPPTPLRPSSGLPAVVPSSLPTGLHTSASLPQFTHIPPTPQQAQGKFFESPQQNGRTYFQQPGPSASSPTEDESSNVTPLPIEDAIAFAEQLNQEYKQRKEERKLKGETETTTTGDDSSLASSLPHTPNSDELFHYPHIDNTYDYEEQEPDLSEAETTRRSGRSAKSIKSARSSKNGRRAATSDQRRTPKAITGRSTAQSADGKLNKKPTDELALVEALASGQRPLPSHMRLQMPIDSPEAMASKRLPPQKPSQLAKKSIVDSRQGRADQRPVGRAQPPQKQGKPPIPAAARRQPPPGKGLNLAGVRRADSQKPPRPPSSKIPTASSSASGKVPAHRPEGPLFGHSRSSTMSSGQKRQAVQSEPPRRVASSLPNSDRHLKRGSLPMGDLQPPKRSPSLPSIGEAIKPPKLDLKKADFMLADIDLDLPGPHMIPATLDDIKSGRLAEVLAGTSKDTSNGIIERVRETTVMAHGKITNTKQSIIEMDPDLEDSSHLPPISDSKRLTKGPNSLEKSASFSLVNEPLGLRSMTADAWHRSMMDSARKKAILERRVHENCLTDRPPWDDSPLRAGDLDKIPLDFNLPRSHSLSSFTKRSKSFGATSERKKRRMQHENPLLLADLKELTEEKEELIERRVSRGWKQIGKMPEDAELRRQWVEDLKASLNSQSWLKYD